MFFICSLSVLNDGVNLSFSIFPTISSTSDLASTGLFFDFIYRIQPKPYLTFSGIAVLNVLSPTTIQRQTVVKTEDYYLKDVVPANYASKAAASPVKGSISEI
jgi:hypothetical protein